MINRVSKACAYLYHKNWITEHNCWLCYGYTQSIAYGSVAILSLYNKTPNTVKTEMDGTVKQIEMGSAVISELSTHIFIH